MARAPQVSFGNHLNFLYRLGSLKSVCVCVCVCLREFFEQQVGAVPERDFVVSCG